MYPRKKTSQSHLCIRNNTGISFTLLYVEILATIILMFRFNMPKHTLLENSGGLIGHATSTFSSLKPHNETRGQFQYQIYFVFVNI